MRKGPGARLKRVAVYFGRLSPSRYVTWLCCVLVLILGIPMMQPAWAQGSDSAAYKIGPGDVLSVIVYRNADLTLETEVSENGKLRLPLVGDIEAAGRTPFELGQVIEQKLQSGNFVRGAQVTVLVTKYQSRIVTVIGEVAKPGRYPIETGKLRLSELIALAGGILPTGSDTVTILRDEPNGVKRLTVDVADVFSTDKHAQTDVAMVAGDRVFVDKAPTFFIRGEVQKPGTYPISRGLTIGQAIAVGGGTTMRGNEKHTKVYRMEADGSRQIVSADRGSPVLANDEIVVEERIF